MSIFATLVIEFVLVVSSILVLFKLRDRLGLAPLFILLGTLQFLQANLGSTFSLRVFNDYIIYPGSILLFSGVLFAVLLVYINEGVKSARALIIGIVISNVIMTFVFEITNLQQNLANQLYSAVQQSQLIKINVKYFFGGTIILIFDFLLLVICYQYLISKFKNIPYYFILFTSLGAILTFDALAFNVFIFYGTPEFKSSLVSHLIGKSIAALLYSVVLYFYIKYFDGGKAKSNFIAKQKRDVLSIISVKTKYEKLKVEKVRVEKKLTSQLEETLSNISDGFISLDLNWCYTYINQRAANFLGKSPESLIGKHIWTEFPEGVGSTIYKVYHKALKTQKTLYFEDYYEPAGKWFLNRVYPTPKGLTVYFTDITDRKQAEEDLKNSELLFRRLTSSAPVGIFQTDTKGSCNFVNQEWLGYAGMSFNEAMGLGWANAVFAKDRERVVKAWEQYLVKGGEFNIEFRFQNKEGKIKWVSVKAVETFDANDKLYGYIGMTLDITERKEIEDKIKKSQKYLENIINNIGDPVFVKDSESRMILVNDALCSIFNLSRDQIIGKTLAENVPKEERGRFLANDRQVLLSGLEDITEETVSLNNNEERTISTKKTRFVDSDNNKFIIGTIRDITGLKNIEEQLTNTKNYLDNIINNIGDPVFVKDEESRMVLVNDALCASLNLTRDEMLGSTLAEDLPPEEVEVFFRTDKEVLSTGVENINVEHLTSKENGTRIVSTKKTRFVDSNGNKFLIGIIRDITEQKKAEKEILSLGRRNTLIIETLLDGFILADTTGNILDVNLAYVKMIGYSSEELLALNINQLEVALNRAEIEERIKEMVRNGFARFNSNHKKKNGEIIDLDVSMFTMKVNGKQVIAAFVKDITEQKKAEAELEKHRNHLEELVKLRTEEVDAKNAELQRMNKLFVGRELRMKELKNIIKDLQSKNDE